MSQALFERAAGERARGAFRGHDARRARAPGGRGGDARARHRRVAAASRSELTDDLAQWADVVVTMGCGDECPYIPGKRYLDWDLPDPKGRPVEEVRGIRDDVSRRVREWCGSSVLDGPASEQEAQQPAAPVAAPALRAPAPEVLSRCLAGRADRLVRDDPLPQVILKFN